eukprot:5447478-Amphidinium_carterae.1
MQKRFRRKNSWNRECRKGRVSLQPASARRTKLQAMLVIAFGIRIVCKDGAEHPHATVQRKGGWHGLPEIGAEHAYMGSAGPDQMVPLV